MSNKPTDSRRSSAYSTQAPFAGQEQLPSADAAEPADNTADRPAFGTLMAPPVSDTPPRPPRERELPCRESLQNVSRTRRADDAHFSQVRYVARSQALEFTPEPEGFATPPEKQPSRESQKKLSGKSTWNLRIKQRGVAGHISGVINALPDDPSTATGLQSALIIDESVPEYEVISELGAGNMGIVYRARQTSLNRELAIKTLKPDSPNVDHDQAMFVSEAVVTANLVHPNIIPIHDLGRTADGKLFYSMKQVTGTPWNDTIRENSVEENLDIFMKLCDAVAYAHSRGVINRDLKPENVIVGDYGEVIVLDWGLAITTEEFAMKDSVIVEFRGGAGTPVYMPPELADEDVSAVGNHSDVYLLGAILFEILEGFPPHLLRETWDMADPDEQLNSVIWAVLNNQIEPNVIHQGELMQIARTAMSTHPQDRYASVEQLQEAIREFRITGRAEELMQRVESRGATSYAEYQSAVALYEEALRKWPHNRRALDGDRKARLAYAELAHKKGDIDLGLQVVSGDDLHFHSVRSRLKRTGRVRRIIRGTWTLLFVAAISLAGWAIYQDQRILHASQAVESAQQDEENARAAADAEREAAKTAREAAKIAKADAERERKAAESLKAEAVTAKQERDDAQRERDNAQMARSNAVADKDAAEAEARKQAGLAMAAEAALKSAEQKEQEALNKAEAANKAAEQAKTLADFDILVEGTNAKLEIGNYDAVVQLTEQALDLSVEYDFIRTLRKNDVSAMRKKRRVALDSLSGNTSLRQGGVVETAVFSRNGNTLVTFTREDVDGEVTVERTPDDLTEDRAPGHHLKFSEAAVSDLAVSDDGAVVFAIGDTHKRGWVWNGDRYSELRLPEDGGLQFSRCLLSGDGKHAYLLGYAGGDNTLEIYDLTNDNASLVVRRKLDSVFKVVHDAVVLPDESALIVILDSGNCRSVALDWTAVDGPVAELTKGLRVDAVFPRLMGLEDLGEGGRGDRFEPEQMSLSADGTMLALFEGPRAIVVPRINPAPDSNRFPFASPKDIRGFAGMKCSFNGRVDAAAFSHDNSRLVTAQDRDLQYWERDGNTYRIAEIEGLYEDVFLAGHSAAVKSVGFIGKSNNHILSVAADHTIRKWNTDLYGQYVQQMWKLAESQPGVGVPRSSAKGLVRHPTKSRDRRPERVAGRSRSGGSQDGNLRTQRPRFPEARMRVRSSVTQPAEASKAIVHTDLPERDVAAMSHGRKYFLTGAPQPPVQAIRFQQGRKIYSAEFSRDSARIVVGADDLAAHSFDSRTAKKTVSASMLYPRDPFFAPERNNFLEGHIPEIVSLRFVPPKGDLLLTFDYFGSISVWDAKDDEDGIGFEKSRPLPNEPVVDLGGDKPYEGEDPSCEVTVSADGRWIAAGGVRNDGAKNLVGSVDEYFAVVWKVDDLLLSATPPPYRVLKDAHPFRVTAVAFSKDGQRLVTAGRRGRFVLWDFESDTILATADDAHGADGVSGVFFSSENEFISAGFDGRVLRWSIDGDQLSSQEIPRENESRVPDFVIRLRPNPDGSGFITSDLTRATQGKSYRLDFNFWKSDTGWVETLPISISAPADDLAKPYRHDISWSQDGSEILYVHDHELKFLDTGTWEVTSALRLPQRAVRGTFAPGANGETRIATFDGRFAHMWNPRTGTHLAQFRSHAPLVRAGFSADRQFVATASESIRVFNSDESDPDHGRPIFRLPERVAGRVRFADVRFRPVESDYHFATIDVAGIVKLWDWTPGGPPPDKAVFSSDASAGATPVWNLHNAIDWSDDGNLLAAIQSGTLHLRRLEQGQLKDVEIRYPEGTDAAQLVFNAVDFSSHNSLLTAGGILGNRAFGMVWKISNNIAEPVATIPANERHSGTSRSEADLRGVTAIAFDDAQNEVITGGADSRLVRWQMSDIDSDQIESLGFIVEMEGRNRDGFADPHSASVTSLDIAPDGGIVSADEGGWIVVWPAAR